MRPIGVPDLANGPKNRALPTLAIQEIRLTTKTDYYDTLVTGVSGATVTIVDSQARIFDFIE